MTQPIPTIPEPQPLSTSRRPWLTAALWLGLLIVIVLISLAAIGRTTGPVGAGSAPANALAAAPATPAPSASTAPKKDRAGGPGNPGRGLAPFAFGRGGGPGGFAGPGGPGGPGGPRGFGPSAAAGPITITKIEGSQLSLATADGWTRTIDATGATIHRGGQTITVSDLAVGDQIRFAETRNADGTYKVTDIVVVAPTADGTVKSVVGSTLTITQRDGSANVITLTGSTTYQLGNQAATVAAVTVGAQVHVEGTVSGSTFTATSVRVQPAVATGTVTAVNGSSFTLKDPAGNSVTVDVNSATKYGRKGAAAASLADVKVGVWVAAQGKRNADGSIAASQVVVLPAAPGRHLMPGAPGGAPKAPKTPKVAPSASATTT